MTTPEPPEADDAESATRGTAGALGVGTMLPSLRRTFDRNRTLKLAAGVFLLAYSLFMLAFVRYPYITVSPGNATDVHPLITVDGTPTYEAEGDLVFLTVSLSQRLTLLEVIEAYTRDDVEILQERAYTQDLSREELTRINLAAMQQSELKAIKVALERVGHPVVQLGGGALVEEVVARFPAEGTILVGDIVRAVDGQPVVLKAEAVAAVRNRQPGDPVSITVQRDDEEITFDLKTVAGQEGLPQIGLGLADTFQYQFPFAVDINTGQIGGPSAGLAFTLALIDELTEGELTGGKIVAVTGTIEHDGTVGRVGGVEQKTSAARRSGAALMIVPKGEGAQARKVAGRMKVREVETLEDALAALGEVGGNVSALPPAAPPATPPPPS